MLAMVGANFGCFSGTVLRRVAARVVAFAATLLAAATVQAVEVNFRAVAPGIYAHIGETGGRTFENEGLNADLGLVVAPAGSVLIDSGATYLSARQIHAAVRRVTDQPVKWVINTGGQDHRWLGNGYFKEQGAELIAHANARADMQARGGDHLQALRAVLKERLDATVPTLLRAHMKRAVVDGADISAAIRSFDAQPYMRLLNAAELHPGNASRTDLELERE